MRQSWTAEGVAAAGAAGAMGRSGHGEEGNEMETGVVGMVEDTLEDMQEEGSMCEYMVCRDEAACMRGIQCMSAGLTSAPPTAPTAAAFALARPSRLAGHRGGAAARALRLDDPSSLRAAPRRTAAFGDRNLRRGSTPLVVAAVEVAELLAGVGVAVGGGSARVGGVHGTGKY